MQAETNFLSSSDAPSPVLSTINLANFSIKLIKSPFISTVGNNLDKVFKISSIHLIL